MMKSDPRRLLRGTAAPRAALSLLAVAVLAGCAFTPAYERPAAPVPERYAQAPDATAATPALDWRGYFADTTLHTLIDTALAHNRDLRVAALNVQQAQAQFRIREADRLQLLVDRLLAPHRHPQVVGDMNIHEVCERVRALILAEFPKGLKVVRDYDTSIPDFRADREQLIQAVLNIAHNAAQALAERIAAGDAQITLRTRVLRQVTFGRQRYRLALELHVIDNGPGVPDSIKDRVFSPLVSGRDGGTGLGLTLAQPFVQQHHGLIELESGPGRTDFRILIPLP